MANRLNVIMVHSPPPSASAQRLGESVVGELIGQPGVDLTLIGPLLSLHDSSTDRLTLESIDGDVVVLDWRSAGETLHALSSIGFAGQRSPHPHDPDVPPVAGIRRIYAYDLSQIDDAGEICKALTGLKASRQVRTFTLGGSSRPPATKSSPANQVSASKGLVDSSQNDPLSTGTPGKTPGSDVDRTLDLDELVDELDRLDP